MKPSLALKRFRAAREAANKQLAILRSQLEDLRDAARNMAETDTEHAVVNYLECVYKLYWRWDSEGSAAQKCWKVAHVFDVPCRSEDHPFRILIKTTSGEPDQLLQRRWTRALRYALYTGVEDDELIEFFADNGGLKECGQQFSRSDERASQKAREEQSRHSGRQRVAGVLVFGSRLLG